MSIAEREATEPAIDAGNGAPDIALLTRMANEMFKAMPDVVNMANIDTAGAHAPTVPPLATASDVSAFVPEAMATTAAASAPVPRGTGGALPSAPLPAEGDFRALSASLPGKGFTVPLTVPDAGLLGAMPTPGIPSYYFLGTPTDAPAPFGPDVGRESELASKPQTRSATTLTVHEDPFAFSPQIVPQVASTGALFDAESVRRDFPILEERIHGKRLVWLDNAATTQKPQAVIDRLAHFYERENSNIHRAAHTLAARATDAYEGARETARRFLNAPSASEIVFVRGATEGINLVSQSFGGRYVERGDEIVVTWLEHHSNIVPWQLLCSQKGARLRVVPVDDRGQVVLAEYEKLLGPRTRVVAITHVSNALGTVVPVREMTEMAHRHGARVLVDGAQAVSHMPVDVQTIDCDWYVFSGHKVFGPTGIGVVYGKRDVLEAMPPWQGGGNMIADVTFERTVYQPAPMRFEAGTGNIADAVGLGAALDYLMQIGLVNVARHEQRLLEYATRKLLEIPGLRIIGTAAEKAGVISFVLDGFRTDEVGEALDREGIAVRTGHHCAQPALRRFGLESSVRPSFAVYTTCADIDALVAAVGRLRTH